MKHSSKHWSAAENKIFKKHYPVGGWEACLPHLPTRTKAAILAHASWIDVKENEESRRKKNTKAQEESMCKVCPRCKQKIVGTGKRK